MTNTILHHTNGNIKTMEEELYEFILLVEKKQNYQSLSISPHYYAHVRDVMGKCAPKWEVFELLQLLDSSNSSNNISTMNINNGTPNSSAPNEFENIVLLGLNRAEVFLEYGYFGEAHYELSRLEDKLIEVISLNFNVKIELFYVRVLYLFSRVMKGVKKHDECSEYLESARERGENLMRLISVAHAFPNSFPRRSPSILMTTFSQSYIISCTNLIHSIQLACAEIVLMQAKNMIGTDQVGCEMHDHEKIIRSYLLPCLYYLIVQGKEKCYFLDDTIWLEAVDLTLKSLLKLNFNKLGSRVLKLVEKTHNSQVTESKAFRDIEAELKKRSTTGDKTTQKNDKFLQIIPPIFEQFDEDDEDDDWGISPSTQLKGLYAGYFSSHSSANNTEDPIQEQLFPNNFSLFKGNNLVDKIKKYDETIPQLYSLDLEDKSILTCKDLFLKWIRSLNLEDLHKFQTEEEQNAERDCDFILEQFRHGIDYVDSFSLSWAQMYYECAWKLARIGTRESQIYCYKLIGEYFSKLPSAKITKDVDQEDVQQLNSLFKISLALLEIAAHSLTPDFYDRFVNMKENLIVFNSKCPDIIELIEMKGMCHNITLFLRKQEFIPKCEKIVPKLVEIFVRNSQFTSISSAVMIMDPQSHLLSPPTHAEIVCESLLILHYFIFGISPLTLEFIVDPHKKDFRLVGLQNKMANSLHPDHHYLLDVHDRTELLNIFYHKLPCMSSLKAFVAFSLGLYCRNISNDTKQAERVLFESVYIFQQTSGFTKSTPSLLSQICTRALVELAQVLTENNKYVYSSLLFRAAVENQKLVSLTYDYTLVSDLAELSLREDDWRSGVYYYTLLLSHANEEKMVAKFGHLSSILSSLHIERGDFKNAESYITNSLLFMRSQGKSGEYELNLHLTLAKLFLQSYNFERGLDLLARLMDEKLTAVQRCTVYINLAEAYLKKRWLKECDFVLGKLGILLSEQNSIFDTNGADHIKILEITANCYLRFLRFSDALYCVNIAISHCTAPFLLADLFFLKGKILQKVSHYTSPVSFPTSLSSTSKIDVVETIKEYYFRNHNTLQDSILLSKRPLYNTPQEVLIDALECLLKAKELYNICTNQYKASKVDILIARAQLEFMLLPIVFCGVDPTIVTLPKSVDNRNWLNLKEIEENHIIPALEVAIRTTSVFVAIDAYVTMAEARYLQGKRLSSEIYWRQCRDVMFTLFIHDSEIVVSKGSPPSFLEKLLSILKRLVRLMFCFGNKELINHNLTIIDSYLLLETELEQLLKRNGPDSGESNIYDSTASGGDSSSESEVDEISLVSRNKMYESLCIINSQMAAMTSVKTLPFLRKRRKSSVRVARQMRSMNLLKMSGTGSQSTQSSNGSKSSDGFIEGNVQDLVSEKIWSCIFRMKQHAKKHYLSEKELNFRNQESMRRLYHLISIIKQKTISVSDQKKLCGSDSSYAVRGVQREDIKSFDDDYYRKSLSIDASIESTKHLDMKILEKLVYIIHMDTIITFYTPKTGQIIHQKFGGSTSGPFLNTFKGSTSRKSTDSSQHQTKSKDSLFSAHNIQTVATSSQTAQGKPQFMSQIEAYLYSLLCQSRKDKKANIRVDNNYETIEYVARNVIRGPYDYHSNSRNKKKYERVHKQLEKSKFDYVGLFKRMKSKFFSLTPRSIDFSGLPRLTELPYPNSHLILLCSRSVQALPWELMFDHFMTRNFSLQRIISQDSTKNNKMRFKPQYFCFYSEDELKYIAPVENERKRWIFDTVKSSLHILTEEGTNSGVFHYSLPNIPLHCPIIGYGRKPKSKSERFKFVNFVRLSSISENPTQIITHIESYNSPQDFPVFVFTFADLIDLSEAIICLLNFRPDCTLLFLPEPVLSTALEFLMDMQVVYTNSGQLANSRLSPSENARNGYRFFIHSLQLIKTVLKIPVIVINPPTYSNNGGEGSSSSSE
ncbi:hypothetical protein C9374_010092 [Naegleria lovaniensis]|uniref:Uncharacterized protein n=1 Tax=Naegleria lovaniensis TaxID=51637 RepID=A0AA88GHQ2_NAELO|nr:uncharacterized protein C9374_010092 [Naegleria lovaniensis]KAG2375088.1 hypothetical protein C9374_010092 [Naegleria lovaniensis]